MYDVSRVLEYEGKAVDLITLKNENAMEVELLNYGAALVAIMVPDKQGVRENVVLAYEKLDDYIYNPSFLGVTVGRTSGRIAAGEFSLDGKLYKLEKNFGPNHCHGGNKGFSYRIWDYTITENQDGTAVEFIYSSTDGEEHYPGELEAKVVFTLKSENILSIEYKAKTNKTTLCNLTNHAHFNLSGNYKRPITEQLVTIASNSFLELDHNYIPTGRAVQVKGTPMDFTKRKLVGQDLYEDYKQLKITNGYDHPWLLESKSEQIEMYDKESGRKMTISTTYPSVVVYSFNYPDNEKLKYGRIAKQHDGICFETQYEPNGINVAGLTNAILKPEEEYFEKTEYRFSVE